MTEVIRSRNLNSQVTTPTTSTSGEGKVPSRTELGSSAQGPAFETLLKGNLIGPNPGATSGSSAVQGTLEKLKFSQHAVDRMQARGIRLSPEELGKLETAVQKAAAKGSRDSLVLLDNSAWIVSVKNNTIVTVMDRAALKENVFTNIDSTIVM